jgi:hypothetical protein
MSRPASRSASFSASRSAAAALLLGTVFAMPDAAHAGAADVVACKEIAAEKDRLACFDRTIGGLAEDLKKSDGFSLFGLFGNGGKATADKDFGAGKGTPAVPGGEVPAVTQITAKLASIGFGADGKPIFVLDNGQVWRSQEPAKIRLNGDGSDQATVKRSMLGLGYLMRVNDLGYDVSVTRER